MIKVFLLIFQVTKREGDSSLLQLHEKVICEIHVKIKLLHDLREDTFAEENFTNSRIFGQIAKVYSCEKSSVIQERLGFLHATKY